MIELKSLEGKINSRLHELLLYPSGRRFVVAKEHQQVQLHVPELPRAASGLRYMSQPGQGRWPLVTVSSSSLEPG